MKKVFLACALLSTVAMAAPEQGGVEVRFNQLENQYNALKQKEAALFTQKEQQAIAAQKKLEEQQALYNDVTAKQQQLEEIKNVRFYKEQYSSLANKYGAIRKELEKEMKQNEMVVAEFTKLQQIKGGM
jgi:long-subunit acyl-CoA synthetase (AMP-forming)